MFEHYIWDFDGTLFDTYPMILEAILKTLAHFNKVYDRQEIFRTLKDKSSASVASNYDLNFTEFHEVYKAYEKADPRIPISYSGISDCLEEVIAKGHHNYILTHREGKSARALLKNEEMLTTITEIVGTEKKFTRKPDPASLLYLVNKYHMDPAKTVMIGDRSLDVMAGKNAGVHTIFFDPENILPDIAAADVIVRSTITLKKYM